MIRQIISQLLVVLSVIVLISQMQSLKHLIGIRHSLDVSPITYSELIPDKEEYFPGELIGFSYTRTAKVEAKDLPLPMLTVDSFENLGTGEIFTSTSLLSRIVRRSGTEHLRALRRLSLDCTPGDYSFDGWLNTQGAIPTQPVLYSSRKFKVKPRPVTPSPSPSPEP